MSDPTPRRVSANRFRVERLLTAISRRSDRAPEPFAVDPVAAEPPAPRSLATLADDLRAVGVTVADDGLLSLVPDFRPLDEEFLGLLAADNRYSTASQGAFCPADASTLFAAIAHHRPQRIIEVGVGHSTCVMLDAIDQLGLDTRYTGMDIHIGHLFPLLHAGDIDRHTVLRGSVTGCPIDTFAELQAGDILFIDSSHQYGPGSDVQYLFDEVLPRLAEGVVVHVHDIYFDPVRRVWYHPETSREFNEPEALGEYLAGAADEVVYFCHLSHAHAPDEVAAARDANALQATLGGSIWFVKRSADLDG